MIDPDGTIEFPEQASTRLDKIFAAGDDADALVRAIGADAEQFVAFLKQSGLYRDPEALELLEAAQRVDREAPFASMRALGRRVRSEISDEDNPLEGRLKRLERKVAGSQPISVKRLARYERHSSLTTVMAVAHVLERPRHELASSVMANFDRGVRYWFFVSPSSYRDRAREFEEYFRQLYRTAEAHRSPKPMAFPFDELFRLRALPYDWTDYPYVFYEVENPADSTQFRVLGFRGTQQFNGIADSYERIPARYAETISRALRHQRDHAVAPQDPHHSPPESSLQSMPRSTNA